MPVEFISATHTTDATEAGGRGRHTGFDVDYTRRFVRALDDGGFDWTLVAYSSASVDAEQIAQFVVNNSERIKPMLAHRPGFVFPTRVAKALATLDRIGKGRLGVHIISGGDDTEQAREGDYLTKAQRYDRSEEFIRILRAIWGATGPISHEGTYYRFEDFATTITPYQDAIPVSVGGSSPEAYRVGGRQGDIFGLWGEPLKETAEQIAAVNAVADAAGRPHPRIWVSFRPIVAATDELAWEKARAVLGRVRASAGVNAVAARPQDPGRPANTGSRRLLDVAARGERHDRALWTPLVTATNAAGSTTALVGSYETVAKALLDYVDIGCELLSIRGWDPLNDAVDYARYVLPLVRQELAHRAAASPSATASASATAAG
ncbi:LLM class flavin-dependent oxidoreductase [Actinacidiphila acididurans]|uniref:LLM class flavin-dependent oxidoreductase n=1 Tax=Actinacidiphila acididurans TaxID=2784346 RepID=A0ABS2U1X8_9ACTN|nr:LLM class flavin-dependent oxidoreductase [Actinacidiphila acididurans]MBM9509595.1 LLM class flavin-dependent oxidoreductase [Actinacidiphila acididurans]